MIFFLVPVFNEERNITNLHRELMTLELSEEVCYVFADDGSIDGSVALINGLFKGKSFTVLGDGINRGPGAVFNTGFEWILKNSQSPNDTVVTLEADCTSDLSILPTMLSLNKHGYDLVLASVYAQGGGFDKTSLVRKFISAIANFAFRFIFNVQVLTLSSFYRVYSTSLLGKVKQRNGVMLTETGFICMVEILIKCIRENAQIIEVPMKLHSSKRQGQSKMKVIKTTIQYFRFLARNKFK